jgi:hypothetical protein
MFEFDVTTGLGIMSRMCGGVVCAAILLAVLFFGNVNQVLVRLWARATDRSVFGWGGGPVVRSCV